MGGPWPDPAGLGRRPNGSSDDGNCPHPRRYGRIRGDRRPRLHTVIPHLLAEALALAGKIEEGLAALDHALATAAVSGERGWNAEIHRLRGELTTRLPQTDPAKAEESFRTALAIAREQSTRGYELRAATSLARLWLKQGRRGEACDLLAPVYAWFTAGFDTADLKEAAALLAELT